MIYYPAPKYQVTKNVDRPFPWWRRTCEIFVSSRLKEGQLSRLADKAINLLLKDALLSGLSIRREEDQNHRLVEEVLNTKRLVNISSCPNLPLLSIAGTCLSLEDNDSENRGDFNIELNTNFLEFGEKEKIIFTISSHIHAPVDITFSDINLLGRLLNFEPERFSLSLGFFKPTFISSSLGAVPEMLEGVEITATAAEMKLRIWSESLPRGAELPLTKQIGQDKCWLTKVQTFLIDSLGEEIKL